MMGSQLKAKDERKKEILNSLKPKIRVCEVGSNYAGVFHIQANFYKPGIGNI